MAGAERRLWSSPSSRVQPEEGEERRIAFHPGLGRVEAPPPSAVPLQDVARAVRDGIEVEVRHAVCPERHTGTCRRVPNDNEVQSLLQVRREPHGHHAELDRYIALLPMRIEHHMVRVAHRAPSGKTVGFTHSASVDFSSWYSAENGGAVAALFYHAIRAESKMGKFR